MLRLQYEETFKDNRLNVFSSYYKGMNPFERDILVLYSEYNSYRDVAAETYCSHQSVKLIMNKIKKEIKELYHTL